MKYDVVIEGGGAKGFVLAGAYAGFAAQGHTVGRIVGTSAGAIAAVLVAAGYSPEEMLASLDRGRYSGYSKGLSAMQVNSPA